MSGVLVYTILTEMKKKSRGRLGRYKKKYVVWTDCANFLDGWAAGLVVLLLLSLICSQVGSGTLFELVLVTTKKRYTNLSVGRIGSGAFIFGRFALVNCT